MIKAVKALVDEEYQSQLFSLKETMCYGAYGINICIAIF